MNADKRSKGLTDIPENLLKIAADIAERGNANLTRLTVLKKWFGHLGRLPPFAIWVASRAISGKGKTGVEATELLRQARRSVASFTPRQLVRACAGVFKPAKADPGEKRLRGSRSGSRLGAVLDKLFIKSYSYRRSKMDPAEPRISVMHATRLSGKRA